MAFLNLGFALQAQDGLEALWMGNCPEMGLALLPQDFIGIKGISKYTNRANHDVQLPFPAHPASSTAPYAALGSIFCAGKIMGTGLGLDSQSGQVLEEIWHQRFCPARPTIISEIIQALPRMWGGGQT